MHFPLVCGLIHGTLHEYAGAKMPLKSRDNFGRTPRGIRTVTLLVLVGVLVMWTPHLAAQSVPARTRRMEPQVPPTAADYFRLATQDGSSQNWATRTASYQEGGAPRTSNRATPSTSRAADNSGGFLPIVPPVTLNEFSNKEIKKTLPNPKDEPLKQGTGTQMPQPLLVGSSAANRPALLQPAEAPRPAVAAQGEPLVPANAGLGGMVGGTAYLLAEQPTADGHFMYAPPTMSSEAALVPYSPHDFAPDAICWDAYDPYEQQNIYLGKSLNRTQRPLIEWFKPWYQRGQIKPGITLFGKHNPIIPQFLVYGDYRTGWASNTVNGNQFSVWAHRLNLDFDLRLTSTGRFHWFMTPLNQGPEFTRLLHDDGDTTFVSELNPDVLFGFFEGDLGAFWGGLTNKSLPFDLPFAIGAMPLLFQNGIWMEDAFVGVAATIPARNSPKLDISNMDTTFFVGFDAITSPAFNNENSAARMYGVATFIEAWGGYVEMDYAYLEDRRALNRSYHNSSIAYTRRFGTWLSHSSRIINNAGQDPNGIEQTADGTLLLFENSLITNYPSTRIPYFNAFVGFDRPQSAARDPLAGGILRNTGILFETDGLTGYPFLDDTANNTMGGAVGLNLLADDFSQQLVLETAVVLPFEGKDSLAQDPQYGFGLRYQIPLNNSVILRSDAMYGIKESAADLQGVRVELRKKW